MSKTPRTDRLQREFSETRMRPEQVFDVMRQLETELTALRAAAEAMQERIKELEVCISNQASMLRGKHEYVGQDFAFRMERLTERAEEAERKVAVLAKAVDEITRIITSKDYEDWLKKHTEALAIAHEEWK